MIPMTLTPRQSSRSEAVGARDVRDQRLRRRLRHVLQPGDEIDHAFVVSTSPTRWPRLAARDGRSALAVIRGGAIVVARLGRFGEAALLERLDGDAVGATNVAPGDCYVDVAGRRHWVSGVWTYSLYRLHADREAELAATAACRTRAPRRSSRRAPA
jgi:hypothetical protein